MVFVENLITKRQLLQQACDVAKRRLRNMQREGTIDRFTLACSLRILTRVSNESGVRSGPPPQTITFFLCPTVGNPFFARDGFKDLLLLLDYSFEYIEEHLSANGLTMPPSLRAVYEVYYELLSEHPEVVG